MVSGFLRICQPLADPSKSPFDRYRDRNAREKLASLIEGFRKPRLNGEDRP